MLQESRPGCDAATFLGASQPLQSCTGLAGRPGSLHLCCLVGGCIVCQQGVNSSSMATYKISVNLSCHGGYPLSCTVGLKRIRRSGSLETWSFNCASIRSVLICSCRTSPFWAISASVRVRSTMVSRPSCSERRRTVRCWRSSPLRSSSAL